VAHELAEELHGGALCLKCVAIRRRLPLATVQRALVELEAGIVLRHGYRCRECGGSRALGLAAPRRSPGIGSRARTAGVSSLIGACARVLAALRHLRGEPSCIGCVALAAGIGLADARAAMTELSARAAVSVDPGGVCAWCRRRDGAMTA
jgi:hypothetical protein